MNFETYQKLAHETAIYPNEIALAYITMGLVGEAGEIANKVKKIYRDCGGVATSGHQIELAKELGDVLWYCAELATAIGFDLEVVAMDNIAKLTDRKNRDKLGGSGDAR